MDNPGHGIAAMAQTSNASALPIPLSTRVLRPNMLRLMPWSDWNTCGILQMPNTNAPREPRFSLIVSETSSISDRRYANRRLHHRSIRDMSFGVGEILSVASVGLAIPGVIDVCIKYGSFLKSKYGRAWMKTKNFTTQSATSSTERCTTS